MPATYKAEVVHSPSRATFDKKNHRRWQVFPTMVDYGPLGNRGKHRGRYIVPLTLVRPDPVPVDGYDYEANSYLVGRSWQGGVLQIHAKVLIRTPLRDPVPETEPRPFENRFWSLRFGRRFQAWFRHVMQWCSYGPPGDPHPVLGHFTVKVKPALTDRGAFESEG